MWVKRPHTPVDVYPPVNSYIYIYIYYPNFHPFRLSFHSDSVSHCHFRKLCIEKNLQVSWNFIASPRLISLPIIQWIGLPSGELTQQWKITIFNGKIHYKWPFSIAMLVHQRVSEHLQESPVLFLGTSMVSGEDIFPTKPIQWIMDDHG